MYLFGKGYKKYLPLLGMLPAIIIYLMFTIIPSISTAVFSLTDISGIEDVPWKFIGFENYKEIFFVGNTRDTVDMLVRTFAFAFVCTFVQNIIGLILAVVLNKKIKGRVFYRAVIFLPVILGVAVSGLVWTLMFGADGPINAILLKYFNTSALFLSSYDHAFKWVMAINIWMWLGSSMIFYLAGLQAIPLELYEAGKIDGTNAMTEFWRITLPNLAPTITTTVLLALIGSLQVFDVILVLTGGQFNTYNLGMRVYQYAFGNGGMDNKIGGLRMGYGSALAMVMFVIVFVVTVVSQYYLRKREEDVC